RRLAGDIYIPADAELVPALLPAEAVDMSRQHGLVFLPGGDPLSFDLSKLLMPHDVAAPAEVVRDQWQPFPTTPQLAKELTVLRYTGESEADAILEAGGPEEGFDPDAEATRPPSANLPSKVAGNFAMQLGKAFN